MMCMYILFVSHLYSFGVRDIYIRTGRLYVEWRIRKGREGEGCVFRLH